MQVTYVGDPRNGGDGPKHTEIRGFSFVKNEAVDMKDEDAALFKGHSHFVVGEAAEPLEDHDDPTKGMNIEELRAKAEELGIDHEGVKKAELREMIREKLAA